MGLPSLATTTSTTSSTTAADSNASSGLPLNQYMGIASTFAAGGSSSWASIPARFHPRPLGQDEMDAIRFGGEAQDILPIGYKAPPAAAKKGGKKK